MMNNHLLNRTRRHPRALLGALATLSLVLGLGLQSCGRSSRTPAEAVRLLEEGQRAYSKSYISEARDHWQQAVEIDSTFAEAWLWLARAHGYFMDYEESHACMDRAQLHADNLGHRDRRILAILVADMAGKEEAVSAGVDALLSEFGDDEIALSFAGPRMFFKKDYVTTLKIYNTLIEVDPTRGEAYNMMGYAYAALGRFDEAMDAFQKYAFVFPEQPNPHDSLGELYLRTGRYEEALQEFRRAVEAKIDFVWSYQHRAMTLEEIGRLSEARALCLESMNSPNNGNGLSSESWGHFGLSILIAGEKWDQALREFEKFRAQGGDSYVLHYHGTRIHTGMGDLAGAHREYEAYLQAWTRQVKRGEVEEGDQLNSFGAHYLAGLMAMAENRWDEAAESFRRALNKNLGWQVSRGSNLALMKALVGGGRSHDALVVGREILAVNPREPMVNFLMGKALENQGESAQALRHFQVAASTLAGADGDHPLLAPLRERLDALAMASGS